MFDIGKLRKGDEIHVKAAFSYRGSVNDNTVQVRIGGMVVSVPLTGVVDIPAPVVRAGDDVRPVEGYYKGTKWRVLFVDQDGMAFLKQDGAYMHRHVKDLERADA